MDFIKTTIFYCSNISPKGCKLASIVDMYPFSALGQVRAMKWWIKKIVFFSRLTPSVKPLGLISLLAPIEMLDLSSSLALTPNESGPNLLENQSSSKYDLKTASVVCTVGPSVNLKPKFFLPKPIYLNFL
jgi:hypothetical protein